MIIWHRVCCVAACTLPPGMPHTHSRCTEVESLLPFSCWFRGSLRTPRIGHDELGFSIRSRRRALHVSKTCGREASQCALRTINPINSRTSHMLPARLLLDNMPPALSPLHGVIRHRRCDLRWNQNAASFRLLASTPNKGLNQPLAC